MEAPWGFAFDSNPREVGGIFVAYVVEGSKAEKAGLVPGKSRIIILQGRHSSEIRSSAWELAGS